MNRVSHQSESIALEVLEKGFDPHEHYALNTGPTHEFGPLSETPPAIRNIGWTLGNDCPYRCTHCYSMNARQRGRDMERWMIDRIVGELHSNGIETVNLGGNEPLFTNGRDPRATLLPYIIESLAEANIQVGLTTSGISLLWMRKHYPRSTALLNDVDVSFDSPFENEHNANRGARIYHEAVAALKICQDIALPRTCIMCGMSWNFTCTHIEQLVALAKRHDAHVRINPMKPIQPEHMGLVLTSDQYYEGFSLLHTLCTPVDLGEPPIASITGYRGARRCPCGRTSFRIHSITPDGAIHVSPCVYLHDYKAPLDLLRHPLKDIINSPQFRVFRQRNRHAEHVLGCEGCDRLQSCGGGCAARSYLHGLHAEGIKSMRIRDPYCPERVQPQATFPDGPELDKTERLVHMDYLCTWIGKPR